jgi:fibronectin type III domain protein
VRLTLSPHGRRNPVRLLALLTVLLLVVGAVMLALARPVAAATNLAVLGSHDWTQRVGLGTWLHLVAEVQNNDAADVSLVSVTFNLYNADGDFLGPETTTPDTGLDIIAGHGAKSPYQAFVPRPSGYDHFVAVAAVNGAPAPTAPDQNFTIVSKPCAVLDSQHVCGTITNDNLIRVDGVRVIFSFYSDLAGAHIVDEDFLSVVTDKDNSLAAGDSADFELLRDDEALGFQAMAMVGESSTTTPAAPSDAFATRGNHSATVTWSPPPAGDRPITGYTVSASPAHGSATVAGDKSSATITGLSNGVHYTFTVRATNAYGTGPPSDPSNEVTPATVPDAPNITSVVPGDASVTVSWSAPFDEGSPITSYSVAATPNDGSATVAGNLTSATISGLTNGTSYTFKVTASNALGTGPASAASSPVTPRTVPGKPTNVTATAGDSRATVSWTAPASNGGAAIQLYIVTSAPGGKTATTPNGTTTTATVTGLTNGVPYTFTVKATNAAGSGAASSPSNSVTPTGSAPPSDGPVFGSWQPRGGVLASPPIASTWGPNRLDAFAQGTDRQLWHNWFDGSWHWEPLPGLRPTSDATAVSLGVNQIDVFVRGSDSALWRNAFRPGAGSQPASWRGWVSLGGRLASAPSAVAVGSKLEVFVQGTDNRLYYVEVNSSTFTFSWSTPGGLISAAPSAVLVKSAEFGAFVRGTDSALWFWSSVTTWHPYGGRFTGRPAGTSFGDDRLNAFVMGTDGALWRLTSSNRGATGTWQPLGGRLSSVPSAVTNGNRLEVFARGTDGALWHDGFGSNGVWIWENLGGPVTSMPGAVSRAAGRLDVFAWNGGLWHIAGTAPS